MNTEEDPGLSSALFSMIMKPPERLVSEFQIPRRTAKKVELFQCPCRDCDYTFSRANKMISELAEHIAKSHLMISKASMDSAVTKDFVDKLKDRLDKIIKQIREGGPRRIDSVKKSITAFGITFQKYKDDQHPVETGDVDVSMQEEDCENIDDEIPGGANNTELPEEAESGDDRLLFEQGIEYVRTALRERRRSGLKVDPPEPKIVDYLKKFELLRKGVTDLVGLAFDGHDGKDVLTTWSQHDYDESLNGQTPTHPAFCFRTEKESGKRYYETDHIWEVQIMATAIKESQRFGSEYELSLGQLITVFETMNQVQNLNGTPWKLNLYKGKLMKDFKYYYDVTDLNGFNTISSIINGNSTYRRMFRTDVPLPQSEEEDTKRTGDNIQNYLRVAMKQALVDHFYIVFFSETEDKALKMLYAVLCSMYEAMFPPRLDVTSGQEIRTRG